MNRIEFAKRLQSLVIPEGTAREEIKAKVLPISEALVSMMPNSLFRYRICNEQQIKAFEKDKIYAVTADLFNDPYDTLVRYDIDQIKDAANTILSFDTMLQFKHYLEQGNVFPESIKQVLPDGSAEYYKERVLTTNLEEIKPSIDSYRDQILKLIDLGFPWLAAQCKKFVTIACFCETVQSLTMWSHYANNHKGFALEYNMRPTLFSEYVNWGLYPVIYDAERYDASSYMGWSFLKLIGINSKNPDMFSHAKCAIHKAPQWEYEKEWRLVDYSQRDYLKDSCTEIPYKPVAIYYGVNISESDKKHLHEIACQKGISEYEMCIDHASSKYEMLYRKVVVS
jgi:hypothetical protein